MALIIEKYSVFSTAQPIDIYQILGDGSTDNPSVAGVLPVLANRLANDVTPTLRLNFPKKKSSLRN